MPPSQSKKESQVHSHSPSHSRAKNQTRIASKPPSSSKAIPQSTVASNKSPSSPASGKASPSKDASKPSSPAVAAPRSRISSVPPSPSQTSIRIHLNSKPTSQQSKLKADSQPSSSSRSAFRSQASSTARLPSQANSKEQPSKKTTVQSTSLQHTAFSASIEDQTTNGVTPHSANQSSQAKTKLKQSPKSKASKVQPQTKEELTSKNTSNPQSSQNSSENPTRTDRTIENGLDPSLESQADSKEDEEIPEKTTNASAKSTSISSSESSSLNEPEDRDSQKKELMGEGDISKAFPKLKINYSGEENPNSSFITLVGDNKGTSMHLLSGKDNRENSIHIRREYKSNPDQSPKSSTEIEGSFNHKTPKDSRTVEDPPLRLYINNNTQGINNSILSNSSFTERNPGARLKFFREPTKSEEISESLNTQKAKYIAKPAERLTYKPTVRRRCLRGLFMESSDSEPENPEKPRRHGCRYSNCKGKDEEIM